MSSFRFIHAADVHLDSPLRGLAAYATAPAEEIREASRRAFENLVELAFAEQVSLVLLAGDLYDGDWKEMRTGLWMLRQLARLTDAGIRVVLVSGNHDASAKITQKLRLPRGVTRLSARRPETLELPDLGDGVAIHGQSYRRGDVKDNLAKGYPEVAAHREDWLNIGLLHTALEGNANHATYAPCSVADLAGKGYDYWALGHVHRWEVLSEDPYIVFPGCVQGRHARETGVKGCALVTVDEGRISEVRQVPLDVLRWAQVEVDLGTGGEPVEGGDEDRGEAPAPTWEQALDRVQVALEEAALDTEGRLLAVRVTVTGETPLDRELRAEPEQWISEVRNVAGQLTQHDIWVEKVRVRTTPARHPSQGRGPGDDLGALLDTIGAAALDGALIGDALPGLLAEAEELKSALRNAKLPADWFDGSTGAPGFNPTDPETLASIAAQGRELLVARLLTADLEAADDASGDTPGAGGTPSGGGAPA